MMQFFWVCVPPHLLTLSNGLVMCLQSGRLAGIETRSKSPPPFRNSPGEGPVEMFDLFDGQEFQTHRLSNF